MELVLLMNIYVHYTSQPTAPITNLKQFQILFFFFNNIRTLLKRQLPVWGVAQLIACLPDILEALSLTFSTTENWA